jgi:hypothetical protein
MPNLVLPFCFCVRSVFSQKQIEPPENFVVPFQAEETEQFKQRADHAVRGSALPISVVQNPMVLIGEYNQSSGYSFPEE